MGIGIFKLIKNYIKRQNEIKLSGLKNRLSVILTLKSETSFFPEGLVLELMNVEEKIGRLEKALSYQD